MGGDEFTVLIPKVASREDTARFVRERIDALSAPVPAADTAMYDAKQTRNAFRFCEPPVEVRGT